jgi:hypothetical protein
MKMKRFMVWAIALVFLFCSSAIAAEKKKAEIKDVPGLPQSADKLTDEATKTETGKATGVTKKQTPEQKAKADKKAAERKAKAEKRTPDKKKAEAADPTTSRDTPPAPKPGKISADEAKRAEASKRKVDTKKAEEAVPTTSKKD